MIVLKSILWIVVISAAVGIIAQLTDLVKPDKRHKSYGPYEKFVKRGLDTVIRVFAHMNPSFA